MRRVVFGRVCVWEQYIGAVFLIGVPLILLLALLVPALARARAHSVDTRVAAATDAGSAKVPRQGSYLQRVENALALCRSDIPAMQPVADAAAQHLADGGKFWATGQASMVSELSGRAGGLMTLKGLGDKSPEPNDVVLYTPEPDVPMPDALRESEACVILFGGCEQHPDRPCFSNHADEAGISPTLANAIPGWVFTAELVAALTRLGKMPVMYESIGAYGGYARIRQYENGAIAWHDQHDVDAIPPGVLGNRFIDKVSALLRRIEAEERADIDRAGRWAAEAHAQGKRLVMYSMGHLFPDEVAKTDIGALFHSGVWNAGFGHHVPPDDTFAEGELIVHIGYQHPPLRLLRRARPAGARVAYLSVRNHRDYVNDPGVIWIDPMWPWPDAVVQLEGYDIPILPASGIVNGAVAWEIHRVTKQHLHQ